MAWSDIFIPSTSQSADDQQANYARQQALLSERMRNRQAAGTLTPDQAASYGSIQVLDDQNAAAAAGFAEGLQEGLNNVTGGINRTLAGTIKAIWAAIPWQLWLVGLVVLFVYLGGLQFLKIKLAKSA